MKATTSRNLARIYLGLFALSSAFPVVASLLAPRAVTRWVGMLDVAIAFLVLVTGIRVMSAAAAPTPDEGRRAVVLYQAIASVPLVLLVVFLLAGDHVLWDVLLPGLAWRGWLLMYSLPAALALLRQSSSAGGA